MKKRDFEIDLSLIPFDKKGCAGRSRNGYR